VSVARYRLLIVLTTILTFGLIVLGAYVRLSDAGLGCPDWPGCYGQLSPAHASDHIASAVAAQGGDHGPVSAPKAWKEMVHRYIATFLGFVIFCLYCAVWGGHLATAGGRGVKAAIMGAVFGSVVWAVGAALWIAAGLGVLVGLLAWGLITVGGRAVPRHSPWLPTLLLGTVVLQGAFGAWTVTMLLKPAIVTGHLIGGMLLLFILSWYAASRAPAVPDAASAALASLRGRLLVGLALLAVQIVLGGWVSTNYAAPACGELPRCQGAWVPPMNFSDAFHVVRELGRTDEGKLLSMEALTAIHWTHRLFALVVVAYLLWLAMRLRRVDGQRRLAAALVAGLLLQVTLGFTVVYSMSASHLHLPWQLPAAAAHNAGAAFLLVLLAVLNFRAYRASRADSRAYSSAPALFRS
jgi:cytochrome c oxidase assembly protein subunit 15